MKYLALLILLFTSCTSEIDKSEAISTNSQPTWALDGFVKVDSINPILTPTKTLTFQDPITKFSTHWEARNVLNPSAIVKDNKVYLFYRAQDSMGTSRIGLAISEDGLHFTKQDQPVFYPKEDDMKVFEWNYKKMAGAPLTEDCISCYFDGSEDPRIVESEDGRYFMTYTAYDGKTARLAIASSKDLQNWTKHGLVLKGDLYKDHWSKAGAIVVKQHDNRMVATKINGKYWMYFGDTNLFMAYSDDLINWKVALNEENHKMISVLHPRMGYFDSRLVEPGPYALIRDEGILVIYNGSNAANFNTEKYPKYTYAAGQALFDKSEPYKLLDRANEDFIHPDKDYERTGEVNEVCFVEGLVYFKEKWFLYYGTADSRIAVAVRE